MKKKKYDVLNALKGRIREEGYTYRTLSKETNISVDALSNKLNGYSLLDTKEIYLLVKTLKINPNEIIKYFFPQMLRNVS